MTVAYITMAFPAGAETFACTDLRTLMNSGVNVKVYSMRMAPRNASALRAQRGLETLPVEYATISGILRGATVGLRDLGDVVKTVSWLVRSAWKQPTFLAVSLLLLPRSLEILRRLEAERPDIIHLFWGHYPSIVAHLVRRRLPGPIISMFLGAYDLVYGYGPSASVARDADVVWTHAEDNVPAIAHLGVARERIKVVHRGVDLDSFGDRNQKIAGRMVCAARLCREKHVDDVLTIFSRVFGEWPTASLTILGDGPDRPRLERLSESLGIQHVVQFRGFVPHSVVRDEMAVAEHFVFMSRETTERLTNATKEAMASGCLCVVTRSPGIHELITDGIEGFVIEHGDVDGAAFRIDWAFRHPIESRAVGSAAAKRIRAAFDVVGAMSVYRQRWIDLLSTRERSAIGDSSHARQPSTSASRLLPE